MSKKILILLFVALSTNCLTAQLVDVINEVYYTDDGTVPGYPPGYTTYRIYARLVDQNDFVKSVYSGAGLSCDINRTLFMGGCTVMNYVFGGVVSSDLDEVLFPFFPLVELDSYLAIGHGNGGTVETWFPPLELQLFYYDANVYSFELDTPYPLGDLNAGWWEIDDANPDGFGEAPDNRVLLGQITCLTGTLSYALNLIIYNDGDPSQQILYCNTLDGPPGAYVGEVDGSSLGLVHSGLSCNDPSACNYNLSASCDTFCIYSPPGDLDCSGLVGLADLLDFLPDFGCSSDCGDSDINGDGIVNVIDLMILMSGCC